MRAALSVPSGAARALTTLKAMGRAGVEPVKSYGMCRHETRETLWRKEGRNAEPKSRQRGLFPHMRGDLEIRERTVVDLGIILMRVGSTL